MSDGDIIFAMRNPISKGRVSNKIPVLTEEDRRLFRESVGEVLVLNSDKVLPYTPQIKPSRKRFKPEIEWSDIIDLPVLMAGDVMSYARSGMPKKVLQRLRRGEFSIDAEIDLHGLVVDEARRQLERFLNACIAERFRCIHLIHGKGYRSEADHPILKNKVNSWLRQHPQVSAFCSAKPSDGGVGAVYVLLQAMSN